jgi:hypothetical protein
MAFEKFLVYNKVGRPGAASNFDRAIHPGQDYACPGLARAPIHLTILPNIPYLPVLHLFF